MVRCMRNQCCARDAKTLFGRLKMAGILAESATAQQQNRRCGAYCNDHDLGEMTL
jgi:hypothetical protein